jgi:hypothetical protein
MNAEEFFKYLDEYAICRDEEVIENKISICERYTEDEE